jgi:hypothetical protein
VVREIAGRFEEGRDRQVLERAALLAAQRDWPLTEPFSQGHSQTRREDTMGWDCTVALMKCLRTFGRDNGTIAQAINTFKPGGVTSSCALTAGVLGRMISPGTMPSSRTVSKKARFIPKMAIKEMTALVEGDAAIFVSIVPDHHFTVLPLDGQSVAILQGFEDTYTLYEWISHSGKIPMKKADFLSNFARLFSHTAAVARDAAVALFAIPGKEQDIRDYYQSGGIYVKALVTAGVNLYSHGGVRGRLGDIS